MKILLGDGKLMTSEIKVHTVSNKVLKQIPYVPEKRDGQGVGWINASTVGGITDLLAHGLILGLFEVDEGNYYLRPLLRHEQESLPQLYSV